MTPTRITVHCADSPNGKLVTVDEIRRWHTDPPPKGRGWRDIGYHFVIYPNGDTHIGRPSRELGAHVAGANQGNLGICMDGRDRFTLAQFRALRELVLILCHDYQIPVQEVRGHYEYPSGKAQGKTCPNIPGEVIRTWIEHGDEGPLTPYLFS